MEQVKKRVAPEVFNAITHGLGVILAIVGTIVLTIKAQQIRYGLADEIGFIIYGSSMIALFLSSTLYHSFWFWRYQFIFQKLDHACIYLLIAGTYTPYLITAIGGKLGIGFLILIWLIAIVGISFELGFTNRFPRLSTILYLVMGWISLVMIYPLYQAVELPALLWLGGGGLVYSAGTFFYQKKHNPWMHVIWHLFVLAGAACMFVSIYVYL